MPEYIDREAVIKAFDNPMWRAWSKGVPIEGIINGVPAADVEPVRHGRWVKDGVFLVCSLCKCEIEIKNHLGNFKKKNYCPNCGAKMDEEEKT